MSSACLALPCNGLTKNTFDRWSCITQDWPISITVSICCICWVDQLSFLLMLYGALQALYFLMDILVRNNSNYTMQADSKAYTISESESLCSGTIDNTGWQTLSLDYYQERMQQEVWWMQIGHHSATM